MAGVPPSAMHESAPLRRERGFSLVDMVIVMGVLGVLSGIAIGVTPGIIRVARGESGASELDAFLKRHREMAIARRRDIEITFVAPNQVRSAQRAVPDPPNPLPAPEILETLTFEGNISYRLFPGVPDTPSAFGNLVPVAVGGTAPFLFSSEGMFLDANSNPVNATLSLGVEGQPSTATAVTILGTTATVQRWRWNQTGWAR